MTKIVIVGGVAGGATAAARLRRLDEKSEIVMLERGEHISFANCGLPYYLGGVIGDRNDLFLQTPERMKAEFGLEVRVFSEVTAVDPRAKTVTVNSQERGVYKETYDRLLLAPGAKPLRPPIEGIDHDRILTLRNVQDVDRIKNVISQPGFKRVVVVGGGFIGVEVAENLRLKDLEITLVEAAPQILAPFDAELAEVLVAELAANGVRVISNDGVKRFRESAGSGGLIVDLASGSALEADLVVLAIGVAPDTGFLHDSGLSLSPRGHIVVNERLETSDPSIFAVGDAIEVRNFVTGKPGAVALAGPANRQARIAADNLAGGHSTYGGALGTAIIKVFGLTAAATGLNERGLAQAGIPFQAVIIHAPDHASYYPGAKMINIKLLFSPGDGRLLGAQVLGPHGVDKRLDVLAAVMRMKGTVRDLVDLELAYAPPFSAAKDPVNIVGYVAENVLNGLLQSISFGDFQSIDPGSISLVDVRGAAEYAQWHLPGAINIPLDHLRSRLGELDRNRPVVVYCKIGLRSYRAARILAQNGFTASSISGGSLSMKKK